jgi:signal transduction histidine kinase
MSNGILRRIDTINRTGRAIMAGHLEQRVPVIGSGDEFDQLATHLNTLLDQIQRLMDDMRQVTDNVAHDLRSPLNRLRSRLELTLLTPRANEAYRKAIEQTLCEADAMLATFNALLSIARVEAGARREAWDVIDIGALARDVAELYQPLAEERGLRFTQYIEQGLALRGDRQLLAQAIGNLIDNALKYTPAGGQVELRTLEGHGGVELSVADNGPGIPADARERVLERFVRLDASRATPGNGLGLSMVRAVARLHHAELELSDNWPGLRVTLRFVSLAGGSRKPRLQTSLEV